MQQSELVIVPSGDDLCFTYVYENKRRLVKVTKEALENILGAAPTLQSRTVTLEANLSSILRIAERKIDNEELPIIYMRDVAATS